MNITQPAAIRENLFALALNSRFHTDSPSSSHDTLPLPLSYLSDVHDLSGALPNRVHPQNLEVLGAEDDLEEAVHAPQHLPLGQLGIVRHAHLSLDFQIFEDVRRLGVDMHTEWVDMRTRTNM